MAVQIRGEKGKTMADEELRRLFARKLNHYLEANKYNQADLARHMHVSTATTAKWCTGQTMPRIDKIQSICNWLGIEKTDLLEDRAEGYYTNSDTARMAQAAFDDPNLRALFDIARNSTPQDIQMATYMLRRLKATNPDG